MTKGKDELIEISAQESGADCISRQAVLDLIEHYNSDGLGSVFYGYEEGVKFAGAVNKLPPVNPMPKMGHWIDREVYDADRWKCSECGRTESYKENYCPNCGCVMKGESE